MDKFDTIDIFFIAIISAYFITLLCIIITIIYTGLSKLFKNLFNKKKSKNKPLEPLVSITLEAKEESKSSPEPKPSKKSILSSIQKLFAKKEGKTKKVSSKPKPSLVKSPKKAEKPKKDNTKVKSSKKVNNKVSKEKKVLSKMPIFRKLFMVEVPKQEEKSLKNNKMEVSVSPIKEEKLEPVIKPSSAKQLILEPPKDSKGNPKTSTTKKKDVAKKTSSKSKNSNKNHVKSKGKTKKKTKSKTSSKKKTKSKKKK